MATEPVANILVVDDSEAICRALRDLLTMSGYTVRTAPSGERALQILETASIDLVITDLKMSGISGIQLLKKIKEKTPALPVVILTGFGDMDSVVEAMRGGVADYLKKPFSVNEVLQVTERELKRSKQLQAVAAVPIALTATTAAAPKPTCIFIFSAREADGIDKVLSALRAETTAESVLLIEDSGHVISAKGLSNERDMPSLAALVVASRSTNAQMASLLGEGESFALNYLEGQRVSVYSAGISQRLLLVVVVPKLVKQGAVWMYTKKAAAEIEQVVAGAIQQAPEEERPPGKQPEVPAVEERPAEKPAERPESVDQLESLFSAEAMAAGERLAQEVQTLTFEEAMARGLLGNMQM
jgi:DNA-binding response OmpR family regulator